MARWAGDKTGRDPASELNELRRSIAQLLGADEETWPQHGNAPLAIAASCALWKQRSEDARADAESARRERDRFHEILKDVEGGTRPTSTCDWGGCMEPTVDYRYAADLAMWLGVCAQHTVESTELANARRGVERLRGAAIKYYGKNVSTRERQWQCVYCQKVTTGTRESAQHWAGCVILASTGAALSGEAPPERRRHATAWNEEPLADDVIRRIRSAGEAPEPEVKG